MKKILITGGTGFIGINLIKKLSKERGNKIFVLSRKTSLTIEKKDFDFFSKIKFLKGDIVNFQTNLKFDEIYHFAYDTFEGDNFLNYSSKTIIDGIVTISKICANTKTKKLVFLSSGAIYGDQIGEKKFKKNIIKFPLFNKDHHYGFLKAAAEQYLWSVFYKSEVSISVYRVFAVIGPYMKLNQKFILGNLINDILENKGTKLKTDCNVKRNIIHVDDLVNILINNKSNKRFQVQDILGQEQNLKQFIKKLIIKYGYRIKFGLKKNKMRVNYSPKSKNKDFHKNYTENRFNETLKWFKEAKFLKIKI